MNGELCRRKCLDLRMSNININQILSIGNTIRKNNMIMQMEFSISNL